MLEHQVNKLTDSTIKQQKMKFEIEDFMAKLNTIQCIESIEFRSRLQKKWLRYLLERDKNTEKELLRLIFEYQKFSRLKLFDQTNS